MEPAAPSVGMEVVFRYSRGELLEIYHAKANFFHGLVSDTSIFSAAVLPPVSDEIPQHEDGQAAVGRRMVWDLRLNPGAGILPQVPALDQQNAENDHPDSKEADTQVYCINNNFYVHGINTLDGRVIVVSNVMKTLCSEPDDWGQRLPALALRHVLKVIVDIEGPLKTICQAFQVNRLWNSVAKEAVLWHRLDFSVMRIADCQRFLGQLIASRNLTQLREVDFSECKDVTDTGMQLLADNCSLLTHIRLTGTRVTDAGFMLVVMNCQSLKGVNLSALKTDAPHGKALQHLLEFRGDKLQSLNLSHNVLKNFSPFMTYVRKCSQLRSLDISNVVFSPGRVVFDIEKLQAGCTLLRSLKLGNTAFETCHASSMDQFLSPGFPDLMVLDLDCTESNQGFYCHLSNFLTRVLKTSRDLKVLNLGGCSSISHECLMNLPPTDLEQLLLSNSSSATLGNIHVIVDKWRQSLEVLDLARNAYPGMSLDMALKKYADEGAEPNLRTLDLSRTQTSCSCLQSLLHGLPNLRTLVLYSCYGIPRGMRKEYAGADLLQLRNEIGSFVAQG